jgi:uncharacterized membrane protein
LAVLIVAAKIASWAAGAPVFEVAYFALLGVLFAAAGAVLAARRLPLLRRQIVGFCVLGLPLMFLQTAGAGAWTQALATHGTLADGSEISKDPVPTLFRSEAYTDYTFIQGRPAGLTWANQALSFILLVALALELGRGEGRKALRPTTVALLAACVLSMAKVVFLGLLAMLMIVAIRGRAAERRYTIGVLLLLTAFTAAYAVLSPGLAAANLSLVMVTYSVVTRVFNLVGALRDLQPFVEQLAGQLGYVESKQWAETGSGLAQIAPALPVLVPLAVAGAVWLLRAAARLRQQYPTLADTSVLSLVAVSVFILASPFLKAPIYWVTVGIAVVPLAKRLLAAAHRMEPARVA